ncbi:MAG: DMT family transporter [Clostridia bacterium]|nr:DMT family transporter [Clostridia bacterium]MBQ4645409.1 DMT family transporter [Clostridia bacterium]
MIKNDKTKGIIYIIISAFFFALMGLFVKLSGDLPIIQKSFFRNAVAMIFALVIILKNRIFELPKGKNVKYLLIRSIAGTLGILCNFYAVSKINLADASMLNKLSPFFAVVFSIFILKERANWKQFLAVTLAFIGALFVMKPTFSFEGLPAFLGFLGGLGAGLAYAYVRKLTQNGFKGPLVIFYFSMFSCVVTLPWLIFDFQPMSSLQWLYLILAGLSASGGQFFITAAYSKAPAKEISVYDYSQIIFTTLLSLVVFGDLPDALSFIGYGIIILAAVFNAWNSLRKKA